MPAARIGKLSILTIVVFWSRDAFRFFRNRSRRLDAAKEAGVEDVEEMQPRIILAVAPHQALVLAAEVKAEAGHHRAEAILAEAALQVERGRNPRIAHEPFQPDIG